MRYLAPISMFCAAVLAVSTLSGTPAAREASSRHYRLAWFEPAGGEAVMVSADYRLRAVVATSISGSMRSDNYVIRPLLQSPVPAPIGYRVIVLR